MKTITSQHDPRITYIVVEEPFKITLIDHKRRHHTGLTLNMAIKAAEDMLSSEPMLAASDVQWWMDAREAYMDYDLTA